MTTKDKKYVLTNISYEVLHVKCLLNDLMMRKWEKNHTY